MRYLVIGTLLLIIASLGTALFALMKPNQNQADRVLKALMLRVGISIILFTLLMLAYYFGWLSPNALR
jgi:uncharacterized BrkB/YihY/UPF0761 family membrane protein